MAGDGLTPAEKRRSKELGVVLATGGLVFALVAVLLLRWLGEVRFSPELWSRAFVATIVVQGALWLVPRLELDERLTWDPHYVLVPMACAAALLGAYIYVAPAASALILMGWFAALLFTARLAGFRQIVALGTWMTAAYLGAVLLRRHSWPTGLPVEFVKAGVFYGINVFAGLVSERLRRDRERVRELQEQLAERAITDPVTGLRNRRYFESYLESELARIRRYGGRCALAMMDLDEFKNYNDTLGHRAGDALLEELGGVLQEEIRTEDVVARYGGEEFAVVMVNTDREEGRKGAERIRRRIEEHRFPRGEIQPGGRVTVSLGVAVAPEDAESADGLVERADEALYRAKEGGKNRVHVAE